MHRAIPVAFLSFALLISASVHADELTLRFLDLSEGDAIHIRFPDGTDAMIDSGAPQDGVPIADRLEALGVRRLRFLFLTHPHLDHVGGAFSLLHLVPVAEVLDNGQPLDSELDPGGMSRRYRTFVRTGRSYRALSAPEAIQVGAVRIAVLWPDRGKLNSDWNYGSLVLRIEYGKFSALLMGDALTSTEAELLERRALEPVTVLKAGHHGSQHTLARGFLDAVRPKLVIVTAGAEHPLGYPAAKTIRGYEHRARTLVTGTAGEIAVTAQADGIFSVSATKAPA